ncbi:MAG: DUF1294 domain-containing protein [Candidatus Limivivens sp.]|nr:DUF1294 domain-containing protein [Candidatus Limivivens sp.]
MEKLAVLYLIGVNLFTFAVYGADKWKAKKQKWRIPERTLLILAAIGGSPGALAGMYFFRHKTKHRLFRMGIPLILAAQVVTGCMICFRLS